MSQAVTSVATVTANDSSSNNSSVFAATTSTVTTISPCPPQQQFSPPQSSVPSQYSQLPTAYAEGFQVSNIETKCICIQKFCEVMPYN